MIDDIEKAVCTAYGVNMQDIRGTSRYGRIADPRHLIFYLASSKFRMTQKEVVQRYGTRPNVVKYRTGETVNGTFIKDKD